MNDQPKAERQDLIAFRVDIYKTHVGHVQRGQSMRYEILRYTIIGLALYFSFLASQAGQRIVCEHPDVALFGLPVFVLAQVFIYISLINRNIAKHGEFLKYFYAEALEPLGLGPNMYRQFIRDYAASPIERLLERGRLHYSQLFVLVLVLGCVAIWMGVDVKAFSKCAG